MNNQNFRHTAVAAALLAAFAPAWAQLSVEDFTQLSQPSSSITAGVGYVSADNRRFGQYTGLNDKGAEALLDVEVSSRDNATGTWFKLDGRNLGQDSRELRGEYRVQGDWGAFLDYNQIPRLNPYTFNTSLQGIGTTTQTASPAAAPTSDVQLDTDRKRTTVGFDKKLDGGLSFSVTFRNEDKTGSRPFGFFNFNTTQPLASLNKKPIFATEPISSNTKQWDALLSYNVGDLRLFAAYYGSAYDNAYQTLNFSGGPTTTAAGTTPAYAPYMALPPSNQSHQLSLYGNYDFTKTTKSTFKLAYSTATQNQAFVADPSPSIGAINQGSLHGRIDTTLAQVGLTSSPTRDLSLSANLRYEDRDNKTPTDNYYCSRTLTAPLVLAATCTGSSDVVLNPVFSRTSTNGKLEANYQIATDYRLIGGADFDRLKQNVRNYNSVSERPRVDEATYRIEVRRTMTESVNGSLALVHSDRTGSDYVLNNGSTVASGAAPALVNNTTSTVGPINLADRKRDKVRLMMTWLPTEDWSLQLLAEDSHDTYSGKDMGARDGKSNRYTLDASYQLAEDWQATAWTSHGATRLDQNAWAGAYTAGVNTAPTPSVQWAAQLGTTDSNFGLGLKGKLNDQIDVGADLLYSDAVSKQDQSLVQIIKNTSAGVTMDALPNYYYKQQRLSLFGKYALDKASDIRLDLVYDRRRTDDWSWSNFTYADGTTVTQNPDTKVTFVGISYIYRWH